MKERRKLFSENSVPPTPRRKLFSEEPVHNEGSHFENVEYLCHSCGHKLNKAEVDLGICSMCGSTKNDIITRRSLFEEDFQKEFSETTDPLELKLKEFSGKEISKDLYEKEFSESERENLEEHNYSMTTEDGGIKISNSAFLESRIFSKIVVSVTKEYDLDPEIMRNHGNFGQFIDNLNANPKCIAILKKTHGVEESGEGWLEDSGICNDLSIEFGAKKMPVPEFKNVIDERYPDAPDDIIEKLKSLGIISEEDGNIEVR